DPHASGGVHTDAVVVVAFALPVPVPGYEGVADREVPDHDVPDVLELESAPDDFRAAADTGDGGVPGDGEVRAEGRDGDGPLLEHDRRGGTGDRLGEGVGGTDRDDLAAEAADGAMRQSLSGNARETGRVRRPDGAVGGGRPAGHPHAAQQVPGLLIEVRGVRWGR